MPIPFIGRLNIIEYAALVGSFLLVGFEAVIRILTLALRTSSSTPATSPSTDTTSRQHPLSSRSSTAHHVLFNRWATPAQKRAEQKHNSIATSVRDASDFVDLCRLYGYEAEEHVTQTKDGFLLGLHRLAWKKGEEGKKVNNGPNSLRKKVVYLHHGLLMNSEVWVLSTHAERCLPFVLVERGYDVWVTGNNRGNKYSKKSVKHSPTSLEFWNFSIDEFALTTTIPDSISYILDTTSQKEPVYIGFSQGTAQAFATTGHPPQAERPGSRLIALAPACVAQVLFLLFGRRSILSSATMWQSILYPPIFVKLIDYGLTFLFNWRTKNITSVVHWFQIIRNKSFQMYDDDVQQHMSLNTSSNDSLVDIKVMLRELPSQTVATEIPHYEHLDFLWGARVNHRVFPHVFDALDNFTDPQHSAEEFAKYQMAREESTHRVGCCVPRSLSRAERRLDERPVDAGGRKWPEWHPARDAHDATCNRWSRGRPVGHPVAAEYDARAHGYQHQAVEHRPASPADGADSRPSTADQQRLDGAQEVKESRRRSSRASGPSGQRAAARCSFEGGRGINIGTGKAPGVSGLVTTGGIATKGVINASPVSEARRKKKKT
ncbi:sterol esterase TGL1 [Verticillium dahliae]|nr:sterol esterase TGL1 [Verticillium dahliae]